MDGNAWLGGKILKGDPHNQNKNGELFQNFLERNPHLTLLNTESFCKGTITRSRSVNDKVENSVIDFVIVCDKVLPYVTKFNIDEEKKYALSNYSSKGQLKYSDHNSIITELNIQYDILKPERRLIFNFKDQDGLNKFKHLTSIKGRFSNFFDNNMTFKKQLKLWQKKLNFTVKSCFNKVRLRKNKKYKCKVFSKRKAAIQNKNEELKNEAEKELQKEEAENNLNKIKFNINLLNDKTSGKQNNIWEIKNKFSPKIKSAVPIAKRNLANKIITNAKELKKLYADHFQHRMRKRPMLSDFQEYQKNVEKKFYDILKVTKDNGFPDWSMKDLEFVLKSLKRSQSQDTMGVVNELFMNENIGKDLKVSLLQIYNRIKNTNIIQNKRL